MLTWSFMEVIALSQCFDEIFVAYQRLVETEKRGKTLFEAFSIPSISRVFPLPESKVMGLQPGEYSFERFPSRPIFRNHHEL
ncbi:uncharacterized protein LOC111333041 isoform X2 [Stylophora pistillata]|uniref:uncharacterized protein LOC111333041 isoform X2 n=1 Tax=Stylophora pistillata TaxID=50429 RepID=UPI000C04B00F|nr:uncharacterized protein LOC111333041 isoform X2 [Stylophora pistillata]